MHVVDCGERAFFGEIKDGMLYNAVSVTICKPPADNWSEQRTIHIPPIEVDALRPSAVREIDDSLLDSFYEAFAPHLKELLTVWSYEDLDDIMRKFSTKQPIPYSNPINDRLCRVAQDGINVNGKVQRLYHLETLYLRFKIFAY